MRSHIYSKRHAGAHSGRHIATTSLLLFLLFPSVLGFKAGHVEPIPGLRKGSSTSANNNNNSNSKNLMLMKLNSSRGTAPLLYETSRPNFYGSTARDSLEGLEHGHVPFVRFPTIPSPFTQSTEKEHNHQDYHHVGENGKARQSSSSLLAREEPSSLFTPEDELDSYYTTGSDATMSSVDIDRYSHETDLYEKQSATLINTSAASAPAKAGSKASILNNADNNNNNNNNPSLSKPTLLPANYLSLAAFRHIDGTLERSSSSIISRIANFWRNMNNRNGSSSANNYNNNNTSSSINSTSSSSSSSSNSSSSSFSSSSGNKSSAIAVDGDGNSAYTNLISDSSLAYDDEIETDHVLTNDNSSKPSASESAVAQPSKFISMEDLTSGGGKSFESGKQHYLNLAEDLDNGSGANDEEHNNVEHLPDHGSVEENANADGSHTFHDDLFYTTGTITATFKDDSEHHQDLMSSGSSAKDRVAKSDSKSTTSPPSTTGTPSAVKGDVKKAESDKIWSINSHFGRDDLLESEEEQEYYGMTIGGFLKRELWTIPLFVLAALNMILIILFEVYVLCRARGQSRRHLFLGQMLLFGLFLCSFLALMFAVHPSIVGCFVGRLGVGITYSLIFSVLMVKCVFLLSLDTGVYLPTSYQGILLFFAVLVQVAIDTQWVIIFPPYLQTVESGRSVLLQCGTSFVQLLYSLSYVGFLVLMVGLLAGRAAYKGVVENYRESVYILITAVVTVPVALSWTVAGWMLQGRHQDACVSFGLVAHSLTTFLIMFMPKGRQLASLDKEGVCFEDQEDQCSGYSPSFFHFKPTTKNYKTALWGDGNLYTTLEPTVSTINPNVFFHRNDFHSGMIY